MPTSERDGFSYHDGNIEPWQQILGSWFPELIKFTDYPDEDAVCDVLKSRGIEAYEAALAAQHYVLHAQGQQFLNEHPSTRRQHHKCSRGDHSF